VDRVEFIRWIESLKIGDLVTVTGVGRVRGHVCRITKIEPMEGTSTNRFYFASNSDPMAAFADDWVWPRQLRPASAPSAPLPVYEPKTPSTKELSDPLFGLF